MVGNNRNVYKRDLGSRSDISSDHISSKNTSLKSCILSSSSLSKHTSLVMKHNTQQKRYKRYPPGRRMFRRPTNSQGHKKIWVPKYLIIPAADLLDKTKKKHVMTPRQ